jgi:uncharacterized protein
MTKIYKRECERKVIESMSDTPVTTIAGPRQCGKTTLACSFKTKNHEYITLDDQTLLRAAQDDPSGLINNIPGDKNIIIDEVQRAPELSLAIKQAVDENRRPGRFILTGSANALLIPQLSDALVGRMEVIALLPFAECELSETKPTFIEKVVAGEMPRTDVTRVRDGLIEKIVRGGFPEPVARNNPVRRRAWHQQYIKTIVNRDLKAFGGFQYLSSFQKLIKMLANYVSKLTDYTDIAGRVGLKDHTAKRYMAFLKRLYLFEELPAWHRNENKRLIKSPKVHIVDTGLLCAIRNITEEKLKSLRPGNPIGHILESYIVTELRRLATWSEHELSFYHYRDKDKVDVDLVIETEDGGVVGIEVKAASTVNQSDLTGLNRLKSAAGEDFIMGVLLYDGDHSVSHGDGIYSCPIGVIWE